MTPGDIGKLTLEEIEAIADRALAAAKAFREAQAALGIQSSGHGLVNPFGAQVPAQPNQQPVSSHPMNGGLPDFSATQMTPEQARWKAERAAYLEQARQTPEYKDRLRKLKEPADEDGES
jgi:hypothetical protein